MEKLTKEQLIEELKKPENSGLKYKPGSEITISGDLFSAVLNSIFVYEKFTSECEALLKAFQDGSAQVRQRSSTVFISLVEKHLENIKNGLTETPPVNKK